MVLVPGFEPGSSPRDGDMMDRTTLHERYWCYPPSIFENSGYPITVIFTFTFTITPLPCLICKSHQRGFMNRSSNYDLNVTYEMKSKPYRIVPLSSLRRANIELRASQDSLVCGGGRLANLGSWKPLPRLATPVEVSPSSWKGLRSRMKTQSQKIGALV